MRSKKNNTGSSEYSASDVAQNEMPVKYRGVRKQARSTRFSQYILIPSFRRLQDPLSELCKIAATSIGVGMYQHDINEKRLQTVSENIVKECVNSVGVDLNTARHISGLNKKQVENMLEYRENKKFTNRQELLKVSQIGKKTFEQCIGFLRIYNSTEPIDSTGIHPESYQDAYKFLNAIGVNASDKNKIKKMLNPNTIEKKELLNLLQKIDFEKLKKELDISTEKIIEFQTEFKNGIGYDPRDMSKPVLLRKGAISINELKIGEWITGTVTNVLDFGAFLDIGVGQDALLHKSEMKALEGKNIYDHFVVGSQLSVRVTDCETQRKRISVSMFEENSKPKKEEPTNEIRRKDDRKDGKNFERRDSKSFERKDGKNFGRKEGRNVEKFREESRKRIRDDGGDTKKGHKRQKR